MKLYISLLLLKLDIKMKIAEGKFHEEKLKLQQKHDADVQKVRNAGILIDNGEWWIDR